MVPLFDRSGNEFQANCTHGYPAKPAHRRQRPCTRCGGQGGSEKWRHTGWTCFRCGGNCIDPNPEIIKLYTAEQNAKLDATAAKKAQKRAAVAAEKARLEQERRDREKAELLAIYANWIKKIEAELEHGEIEVLRSVLERITVQVKDPTEKQVEIVEEIISRNQAERKRRETASFVGEIGERREFTLVKLLYQNTERTGEFPTIYSHWNVFLDDAGCRIVSSSAPWVLGLEFDRKQDKYVISGEQLRVKATVIKHYTDKRGEPCTKINRPKPV